MKKISRQLQATAYHEAGHAVAARWQGIRVRSATIIPNKDAAGQVFHSNPLHNKDPECDAGTPNRLRAERLIRVSLAGLAAQRRFDRTIKSWHGENDLHRAVNLLSYFTGDGRHLNAYLQLLQIEAEGIFDRPGVWIQVEAVAKALLREKTIGPKRLAQIMRESFAHWIEKDLVRLKKKHLQQ